MLSSSCYTIIFMYLLVNNNSGVVPIWSIDYGLFDSLSNNYLASWNEELGILRIAYIPMVRIIPFSSSVYIGLYIWP